MTTPLDRPSTPNGAEGEPARSEPTGESFPQIPGFKILRQLGQGGMGVVYKAHQESLNRVVALKVVSPALAADRELVKRFDREARAMAQLNHPNIVTIYGVGEVAGLPYIVMEYVSGKSLQDMLRREPYLPPQRAISIALQAGEALLYAHQKGVLHRDVKPSNILIEDELDRVKVSDFGLAKILGEEGSFVTETGDIVGTLSYMSPGVAAGEPPSEASDVYALGIILYEMLSGKRPYEGRNQLALMRSIIRGRPNSLPADVEGIPEALKRVVHRAIGRDRRRQYTDMQTFLEDLLQCTPAAPVAARGRETTARIMARIATVDFLVLFLVIGGSFYWVARRTRQHLMEQMEKRARLVADGVLARRADDAKNLRTFNLPPIQFPHPLYHSSLEQRGLRWRHIYQAGTFEPPPASRQGRAVHPALSGSRRVGAVLSGLLG